MNRGLLNRKITVYSKGRVSDGQGGWKTGNVSAVTERGRIRPASASEAQQADQTIGLVTHVAYFRYGSFVKRGYELETSDGLHVKVLGVRDGGGKSDHLEVNCREIQYEL